MALTGCPVMYVHSGPPMHRLSGLDTAMKAAQSRVARADERMRQNRSEGRRARHGYTLR